MSHQVRGLKWARKLPGRPREIPQGRPRAARLRRGLQFEAQVARGLAGAAPGLWWEFEDQSGKHFCQTDLLVEAPEGALVLEVKYTWTTAAWKQLFGLYLPVVSAALGKPAYGLQVCKVLTPAAAPVVSRLAEAYPLLREGRAVTLHWAGQGVL